MSNFFPLKLPMYKVTGSCKCCCMHNSVLYVSFSAFEFICSIFILVIFCRKQEFDLCVANSKKQHKLFTRFSFTHLLPGEQPFLEQEGGIVNRETIIQTEDKGSSPSVGKHPSYCKKKNRIPASWYLSFSSDLPARGQAEYTTMINERSDYYLISAIGSQGLSP